MLDWDDKMQKECASSFIKPLEMDLINKRNKEKVLKACILILTDDDNAENVDLLELWFKVLETVVGRLEPAFVAENATKLVKDIPSLKHPFPKRKRGNRLIFSIAKNVGEEGIDADAQLLKSINSICQDNNYKIRRDGVLFFKDYFKTNTRQIVESDRLKESYLPTLLDFINDEDLEIQIDAIEAVCEVLDQLQDEEIENDFLPCVLNNMDMSTQNQIEIVQRMAEAFGTVVYRLS